MDFTNHPLNRTQYSNSDSNLNTLNNSNSTVSPVEMLSNFSDLIPNSDYNPWYLKQCRNVGQKRFIELANKARKSSDSPAVLFKWMLKNNTIVK